MTLYTDVTVYKLCSVDEIIDGCVLLSIFNHIQQWINGQIFRSHKWQPYWVRWITFANLWLQPQYQTKCNRGSLQDVYSETHGSWNLDFIKLVVLLNTIEPITPSSTGLHRHGTCTCMITSSNGNLFRVTYPLCGEFTGHQWILIIKASVLELWYFIWTGPGQTAE